MRLAPPATRCGASRALRAAPENACAFPRLRALPGSNPRHLAQTKNGPVAGAVSNSMVGDEGFRVRLAPPAPRCGASRALRAAPENACAFPRLRALSGSNPRHLAQTKNGPVAGAVSNSMVGDEGFEPPALCV